MRNEIYLRQQQKGLTLVSWLVIIALASLLVVMGLKLFPVYMEHFSVTSSLKSLVHDNDLRGASATEIRNALDKRLQINEVRRLEKEDITIDRNGSVYVVNITYDVIVPFFYNIEFLVHFDDTVEVNAS